MLSGDVESNPGPTQLQLVLETVKQIELRQASILADIQTIKDKQTATDRSVEELASKVEALEKEFSSVQGQSASAKTPVGTLTALSQEIAGLKASHDDTENRLRRNNLLFFGIGDTSAESWNDSEEKIKAFCSSKLNVNIEPRSVERAHRLGRFATGKTRPIIVKLCNYKDKEKILASGPKLKGTTYAIREDFSATVRLARRKLLQHARQIGTPFRLRFDKMIIDNSCYTYDPLDDSVKMTDK